MNAVLQDDFFYANVHGLLVADMRAFAAHARRTVSDDLCFVLTQQLCAAFRSHAFTLHDTVPTNMQAGVPGDPRIRIAASKTIHAKLRPVLADRLAQATHRAVQPAKCLAWFSATRVE